ncbi:unnamed protein product [Coccothraustes coccothraustes]
MPLPSADPPRPASEEHLRELGLLKTAIQVTCAARSERLRALRAGIVRGAARSPPHSPTAGTGSPGPAPRLRHPRLHSGSRNGSSPAPSRDG